MVAELTHYLQGDIAGEPALAELRRVGVVGVVGRSP